MRCFLHQFTSPVEGETLTPADLYKQRAQRFVAWLHSVPRPLGVLTISDKRAGMLCAMSRAAGFMVPEEVALLSRGNHHYECLTAPVPLSSIDENRKVAGRTAARLLKTLIDGGPPPPARVMIQPSGIVERRSTHVLAVDDPLIARALRFLWDHLEQDLSVEDVASEVAVNRRKLERRFRRSLQRSVREELFRKRLERVCELLLSEDAPVTDIARRAGFRSPEYLHRAFRKAYGMTPRTYRLRNWQ